MDEIDEKKLEEFADSLLVQKHQRQKTERVVDQINSELTNLQNLNQNNASVLDDLLLQAEALCANMGISGEDISDGDIQEGMT